MDQRRVLIEEVITGEEHAGLRLDRLLSLVFQDYSRTFLQRAIRDGLVSVGGRAVTKPGTPVRSGERIRVRLPILEPDRLEPEPIALDILYEDEHVLAVNKPPDMVVHPSRGHASGTLANALLHHCRARLSDVNGPLRPGIVHRLDRDTSGVILCAKSNLAHRRLAEQFKERRIGKEYLAVVRGRPEHDEGEIALPIGRDRRMREKMRVLSVGGRRALTDYLVRERYPRFSLLRARPRTGRTHQLRVHLSFIGHPVACDALYGGGEAVYPSDISGRERLGTERPLMSRQALHALRIGFAHPVTGRPMAITAAPAADLERFLSALRAGGGS